MIETIEQSIVDKVIASRKSIRAFLPNPVSKEDIQKILEIAARAPSGTNTQPWKVYVLRGEIKQQLSDEILQAYNNPHNDYKEEYHYYPVQWLSPYLERRRKIGWDLYSLLGLGRENKAGMHVQHGRNYVFFDAPVGLNLTVAKTTFEESNVAAKQLISAKDAQEFFSLTSAHVQPSADKALAYARHLASITSGVQADFTKAAEAHVADTNRKVVAFVDEISKNAPAGSENAIALLKSAIGNANASYDQINKSAKQVVETLETNLNTAVSQISQATAKAAPRAAKKA